MVYSHDSEYNGSIEDKLNVSIPEINAAELEQTVSNEL